MSDCTVHETYKRDSIGLIRERASDNEKENIIKIIVRLPCGAYKTKNDKTKNFGRDCIRWQGGVDRAYQRNKSTNLREHPILPIHMCHEYDQISVRGERTKHLIGITCGGKRFVRALPRSGAPTRGKQTQRCPGMKFDSSVGSFSGLELGDGARGPVGTPRFSKAKRGAWPAVASSSATGRLAGGVPSTRTPFARRCRRGG